MGFWRQLRRAIAREYGYKVIDVQLRSDDGELRYVKSIREAFEIASNSSDIVKVSWNGPDGNCRFLRYDIDGEAHWLFDPMERYLPK